MAILGQIIFYVFGLVLCYRFGHVLYMLCSVKINGSGRSVGWYIAKTIILLILIYKWVNWDITIRLFDVVVITVCIASVALAIYHDGKKSD